MDRELGIRDAEPAVRAAAPVIFEAGQAAERARIANLIAEVKALGWKHDLSCASGLAGDEGPCDCPMGALAAIDQGEGETDGE
jgi:hypothetical protein